MPEQTTLSISRSLVRLFIILNWIAGLFMATLLLSSVIAPSFVLGAMGLPHALDPGPVRIAVWAIMIIGIVGVLVMNTVLTRLKGIVETVRTGDAFISGNAARLRTIAWSVLALNLMHIGYGFLSIYVGITGDSSRFGLSPTRWLPVFLLFVLASVFDEGARMRDDLEGTV